MGKYNIYHRQDGRWEGRIPKGKNENGKYQFQYVFGYSREAVEEKITEIYRHEQLNICSKTVSELFGEWVQSNKHRVKESTLVS